jgi:hypothetical protein
MIESEQSGMESTIGMVVLLRGRQRIDIPPHCFSSGCQSDCTIVEQSSAR